MAGEQVKAGPSEAKQSGLGTKPAPPPLKVNGDGGPSLPSPEAGTKTPARWRILAAVALAVALEAALAAAVWFWLATR